MGCRKLIYYRYGFNGMEKDGELSGEGNSYTTQFRQYDPRIARWKSIDPLMFEFPWMSPYVAFNNNPVYYIDPLGLKGTNGGKRTGGWKGKGFKRHGGKRKGGDITVIPGDKMGGTGDHSVVIGYQRTFWQKLKTGFKKIGRAVGEFFHNTGHKILQGIDWIERKSKGHAYESFGFEFKTPGGKWNGNIANPVKEKNWGHVITVNWEEIMELAEAADAIGKSQKPESHEEQGDELVTNEQNKGKNGLEEEENLTKKKNDKDVKIYITVYEQRGGVSSPKPYGPYRSVEDFKKSFPNAKPVGNGEFMIYK